MGLTGFFPGEDGRGRAFPHFTADKIGDRIELVRRGAGSRFNEIELNVLVQGVETEKPRERAEEWAARFPGLTPDQLRQSPFVLFGGLEELVEKLIAYRERFGISYITAFWPAIDALAPLVARLKGA